MEIVNDNISFSKIKRFVASLPEFIRIDREIQMLKIVKTEKAS